MKKTLTGLAILGFASLPVAVFAQDLQTLTQTVTDSGGVISALISDVDYTIVLLIGVAVVVFAWYVIKFVINPAPDKKKEAKAGMLWSVIAIAIIVLIFGIVNLLSTIFGVSGGSLQSSDVPTIPIPGASGSTGGNTGGFGTGGTGGSTGGGSLCSAGTTATADGNCVYDNDPNCTSLAVNSSNCTTASNACTGNTTATPDGNCIYKNDPSCRSIASDPNACD